MVKCRLLTLFISLVSTFLCFSQTIPVGASLEDYSRRQQLLHFDDSTTSYTNRPLQVDSTDQLAYEGYLLNKSLMNLGGFEFKIAAPQTLIEWNSHHPYPSNNGAITPAKGIQSVTRIGFNVNSSWLKLQVRPEIRMSENLPYQGFQDEHADISWERRYSAWNRIDTPEQFGNSAITDILSGQSHLFLNFRKLALGVSTENLWWGPGRRNSLLMSNNSRGFPHLSFRSLAPNDIKIGTLDWQFLIGRLGGSGFRPPTPDDPSRPASALFFPFTDDWRYMNALSITYNPKWTPGFFIGFSRAIQQYWNFTKDTQGYLPVFINVFRRNDDPDRNELEIDQLISLFARWVWKEANAELYFEFGRNDASLNFRDFALSPRHSRAFIFGFTKVFETNIKDWNLEINYEHTQLEQSPNFVIRDAGSWYNHSNVRHGYTHRGEVLGASIGPGSNLDTFEFALFERAKKIGLVLERLANNQDFFYVAYTNTRDRRRFWIDYSMGVNSVWRFNNVLIDGSFLFTRSLNYQWELFNNPGNTPYFTNGTDVSNFQVRLGVTYLLK